LVINNTTHNTHIIFCHHHHNNNFVIIINTVCHTSYFIGYNTQSYQQLVTRIPLYITSFPHTEYTYIVINTSGHTYIIIQQFTSFVIFILFTHYYNTIIYINYNNTYWLTLSYHHNWSIQQLSYSHTTILFLINNFPTIIIIIITQCQ